MPSERDEAADDPVIDPVLGEPRMVADPRITADQAAAILGTNRAHSYRMVGQGRLPAYGSPHQTRRLLLSDVRRLKAREESIGLREAAHLLGCSIGDVRDLIASGDLKAVSDARRRVYWQEVQAVAQVRQVKPAPRPPRRSSAAPSPESASSPPQD
jgi:hypothetical protein